MALTETRLTGRKQLIGIQIAKLSVLWHPAIHISLLQTLY